MHPFDASSFLTATSAEGSTELRQQQLVHGAASLSPPPRGTRAGGGSGRGGGIIRCQDCWLLAKAGCAHRRCRSCCSGRGLVCPAHVKPSSPDVPASRGSERSQQMLATPAASASTTAAAPTRNPNKRPRAPVATPTTSSVGQPTVTVPGRFAREVSLDAVFRRVRLGPDAEVAYHATVTIGGHVFRGILYDAGPHSRRRTASADTGGSSDGSLRSTAAGGLDLTLRL